MSTTIVFKIYQKVLVGLFCTLWANISIASIFGDSEGVGKRQGILKLAYRLAQSDCNLYRATWKMLLVVEAVRFGWQRLSGLGGRVCQGDRVRYRSSLQSLKIYIYNYFLKIKDVKKEYEE